MKLSNITNRSVMWSYVWDRLDYQLDVPMNEQIKKWITAGVDNHIYYFVTDNKVLQRIWDQLDNLK